MAKYLLAATPMPGHADPVIAAAHGLAARGHDVVVQTGSLFRGAVERAGAGFVPLAVEIDIDYRDLNTRFPERAALPPGPAQMFWGVRHLFADAIAPQWRGLRGILGGYAADFLLTDMLFLGTLPFLLGKREQRPVVGHLGISSLALSGPEIGFYGAGLPPARTAQQRARNEAVAGYLHAQVFGGVQNYTNEKLAECGAPRLQKFISDAVVMLPDVYFQLGLPELEYDRPLPPRVKFLGALPPHAPAAYSAPAWWPAVIAARQDNKKIVLVTQGTIANDDLGQLVIPTMAALADEDMLVVAVTSGADPGALLAVTPENAITTPFVPYDFILPHVDLLVTNGGFGGVLLALRHGVPVVIAGDSEEKPEIAGRIAAAGAGLDLATGQPGAEMIGDAVAHVFNTPGILARARQIGETLRRQNAIDVIEAAFASAAVSNAA